MQQLGASAFIR